MAHTDNTVPYRLREHYGLVYDRGPRCLAYSHRSIVKPFRQIRNRQQRHETKQRLRMGLEPKQYPRHSVLWEVW